MQSNPKTMHFLVVLPGVGISPEEDVPTHRGRWCL